MTNCKQDDVGYCINITPQTIDVLMLSRNDIVFNNLEGKIELIKNLVNFDDINSSDLFLDAATGQFSDESIDVFVDDESLIKGYPLTAITRQGVALHGNLVVLGNDKMGNTTLLTREQVELAIDQLQFPKKLLRQEVNLFKFAPPLAKEEDRPEELHELIQLLIRFCVVHDKQIMLKAVPPDDSSELGAIVICLQNERGIIDSLYADISKLFKERRYKQ